jgi:ribonuclease Z
MSKRLKVGLWLVLVLLAAFALTWWQRGPITVALMSRQIDKMTMNADPLAALPDALNVGLCGAGSPFPDEKRSGPCTVVVAGRRMFLFDAGPGAALRLARMQLNAGQIEAVFLTHFHSDHIGGLGEVMLQRWIQGASRAPLPVYGPRGIEQVVQGFVLGYSLDSGYRMAHHGDKVAPPTGFGAQPHGFDTSGPGGREVLLSEPDLEIVAFTVEHGPVHPAVGYRVRYKDRSLVISGDTSKSTAVALEAKGVDLLLHEALSPQLMALLEHGFQQAGRNNLAKIMHDVLNYHTTPEEAAEIAQVAGVKALVLNHITPPLPSSSLEPVFLQHAGQIFSGQLRVGIDGDWIGLPTGVKSVEFSQRP